MLSATLHTTWPVIPETTLSLLPESLVCQYGAITRLQAPTQTQRFGATQHPIQISPSLAPVLPTLLQVLTSPIRRLFLLIALDAFKFLKITPTITFRNELNLKT